MLYADATAEIKAPVTEIISLMHDSPVTCFKLCDKPYPNKSWTSPTCLETMRATGQEKDGSQCCASTLLLCNCEASRNFIKEWLDWCCNSQCLLPHGFTNHRHDQSILTVLAYRYKVQMVNDITQYGPRTLIHLWRQHLKAPRVLVVTATTGGTGLQRTIQSVQAQTYEHVHHLIVGDGCQVDQQGHARRVTVLNLPFNSGAKGWNGHRIYSSIPYLHPDQEFHHVFWMMTAGWIPTMSKPWWRLPAQDRPPTASAHIHNSRGGPCVWGMTVRAWGTTGINVFQEAFVDVNCWLLSTPLARGAIDCWQRPARPPGGRPDEVDRRLSRFVFKSGLPVACSWKRTLHYTAAGGGTLSRTGILPKG